MNTEITHFTERILEGAREVYREVYREAGSDFMGSSLTNGLHRLHRQECLCHLGLSV